LKGQPICAIARKVGRMISSIVRAHIASLNTGAGE